MGYGEDRFPFSIAWRVHDAQFWGVPQRRRRISLIADFGGLSTPEILYERKGLSGFSEPIKKIREGNTTGTGERTVHVYENHRADARIKELVDVGETVTAAYGTGGNNQPLVLVNGRVRRLTPNEAERLQGFPDGWTDIGDWTDSTGKNRKCSDSQRYKAIGNSIALPFWKCLARRICAVYERDITIGSLFDGIGGFPLVFKQCGAKALWASEIDEFCTAVTEKHFGKDGDIQKYL